MYIPKQFQNSDALLAQRIIRENPLATVIGIDPEGLPIVSHLPLHWQKNSLLGAEDNPELGYLLGHCALHNPLINSAARPYLVSFLGPHAYMSPRVVYTQKNRVPTWNYIALQVKVSLRLLGTDALKEQALKALIADHDLPYIDQWNSLPSEYTTSMLNNITAFEMQIQSMECAVKINQHRADALPAIYADLCLRNEPAPTLAKWMVDLKWITLP
ncbi:MAG: FMN-binding negative transcriptional regulator [Gammaproteobacteria bacterium]|nr:FMN-binding negative transcriptional regulator [Gammaproteobacteria bacterium]